jgi:hypothetical protein
MARRLDCRVRRLDCKAHIRRAVGDDPSHV